MSGSSTVFHLMVLAFIENPFLNQLPQWWLQNGDISITLLVSFAYPGLNFVFLMNFWLTDVLLTIQLPSNSAYLGQAQLALFITIIS